MRQKIAEDFKIRITTFDQLTSTFVETYHNVGHYTLATAIDKTTAKYQPLGYALRPDNHSLSGVKWVNDNFDAIEILPGKIPIGGIK